MSMMRRLLLRDRVSLRDCTPASTHASGLWARTEVLIGHGYNESRLGKSFLKEVVFTTTNTVPITGVQSVLQYLFGVNGPFAFDSLYQKRTIGSPDISQSGNYTYQYPNIDNNGQFTEDQQYSLYNPGHLVQLFGIGITGTAENNVTVHKVDYREQDIEMEEFVTSTGETLDGKMYPFRYIDSGDSLDAIDQAKYFGKKFDANNKVAYFLKRFEQEPVIKHIPKSEDTIGTNSDSEENLNRVDLERLSGNDAVETFIEIHLKITSDDLKEYFEFINESEACRFNTIALFDGIYVPGENGNPGDYANVKLFSKVNIPTEPLSLSKDLEIIYRIYGS